MDRDKLTNIQGDKLDRRQTFMVSFDLALKVHYPCCYCHCGSRICGNKQVYVMLNYIDTEFSSIVSV